MLTPRGARMLLLWGRVCRAPRSRPQPVNHSSASIARSFCEEILLRRPVSIQPAHRYFYFGAQQSSDCGLTDVSSGTLTPWWPPSVCCPTCLPPSGHCPGCFTNWAVHALGCALGLKRSSPVRGQSLKKPEESSTVEHFRGEAVTEVFK